MGRGLLALAIVFLVVVLVVAISMPREPLGTGLIPLITGNRLTEEYVPPQVIASSRSTLKPGTVWKVVDTADGVEIVPVDTVLIERLSVNGTIEGGDIVAPHLYNWFSSQSDGEEDSIRYVLSTSIVMPFNVSFATDVNIPYNDWPDQWFTGVRIYNGTHEAARLMMQGWGNYVELDVFDVNDTRYGPVIVPVGNGYHVVRGHFENGNFIVSVDNDTIVKTNTYTGLRDQADIIKLVVTNAGAAYTAWVYYADVAGVILDATFYNGSSYFTITGDPGAVIGNDIRRVPAEHTWLWHLHGNDDGKLHVRWVPPGAILKIHYNGKTYEWRINGTINQAGLIEDYTIDLASVFGATTLPNATVELVYPSQKVRVYGPPGFTLRLVGSEWNETATIPDNASYVDFAVPSGSYTVELLGYVVQPGVSVEPAGGKVRIIVTDEDRVALPGAKVYVYDASGELVFAGVTDSIGMVELNKTAVKGDQARIVVSYLKAGKYYHVDQVVSLEANYHIEPVTPTSNENENLAAVEHAQSSGSSSVLVIIMILFLVVAAVALLRRGR